MDGTIRDRMRREQAARFFGREREPAELESRLVDDDGPAGSATPRSGIDKETPEANAIG